MTKVLFTLLSALLIYVGIGAYLYVNQRSFIYYPTAKTMTPYKNWVMENDDEKINIIVLNEGHDNAILYFGGNAESMAESADYIAQQFPEFTVYLMDYRGYSFSTGVSTEATLYRDALKLYDSVKEKHTRISLGGRSLGTAVATYVAAYREVSKLALITPFDSIVNVAQGKYPMYPVHLLLDDTFDSESRVHLIKAKTFIVIAENDEVIPLKHTEKLIEAFPKVQLQVDTIQNRGHSDISSDDRYYKIMQDFIGEG